MHNGDLKKFNKYKKIVRRNEIDELYEFTREILIRNTFFI